ncbi:MAG: hypothetical protein ACU83P_06660 [Gammaproteobacteria bacterium]
MKKILYFLGPLLIASVAALAVYYWFKSADTPGYVLVGVGHWSVETTLSAFTIALILGFFLDVLLLGLSFTPRSSDVGGRGRLQTPGS